MNFFKLKKNIVYLSFFSFFFFFLQKATSSCTHIHPAHFLIYIIMILSTEKKKTHDNDKILSSDHTSSFFGGKLQLLVINIITPGNPGLAMESGVAFWIRRWVIGRHGCWIVLGKSLQHAVDNVRISFWQVLPFGWVHSDVKQPKIFILRSGFNITMLIWILWRCNPAAIT